MCKLSQDIIFINIFSLADDMGLGKTITMIALIASDKEGKIDDDEDDDDDEPPVKGKCEYYTVVSYLSQGNLCQNLIWN